MYTRSRTRSGRRTNRNGANRPSNPGRTPSPQGTFPRRTIGCLPVGPQPLRRTASRPGPENGWHPSRSVGTIRSVPGAGSVSLCPRSRTGGNDTMTEVRTVAGALRGKREEGVAVFRGIPFAEAPVGELRFAAPRPVRGWDGVRDAFSFGPPVPQPDAFGRGEVSAAAVGDEWLTVNVWSPDPDPGAMLPVMVWIQGGGYI